MLSPTRKSLRLSKKSPDSVAHSSGGSIFELTEEEKSYCKNLKRKISELDPTVYIYWDDDLIIEILLELHANVIAALPDVPNYMDISTLALVR